MVFVAVAVAILAVSCVRELDIQRPVTGNQAVISLTPFCVDPVTKADPEPTEPGDNTYNENTISGYYWFISGTADGNILLGGYTPGDGETSIPINSAFPIQNGNNGFVYVIANLPQKPQSPAKGDEWFEFDASSNGIKRFVQGESAATSTTYSGTIADLQAIDFGKSMPTTYTKSSEFYEYTSATTGVPKPEKFVMRTEEPVPFSIVNNASDPIPVKAELKRVAVKIILDLYVAKTVVQYKTNADGTQAYEKTWDSDMSHIQIYMLWGSTRGNLAGTPIRYGEDGVEAEWFYSASPRYAMYKNPDGGQYNNSTNSISGSVPSSLYPTTDYLVKSTVWDYVYKVDSSQGDNGWIWKTDVATEDRTDENRGDYYYGDWAYVSSDKPAEIDPETGNSQRHSTTQTRKETYYKISSLPLYTMPIKWNVNDAHAPFIKVILPWMGYNTGETPSLNNSKEFYYKILIPELTELDANGCYHVKLDLSVLGSTADEVPVEISGEYHVVDWNSPVEAMGGDQTAGRYLDCGTYFEFYSQNEMNIPIRSSHEIEIVGTPTGQYQNYSRQTVSTDNLTYHVSASTGNNFTVKPVGNSKVTIKHDIVTALDQMNARDVSPITYKVTIRHKGDGGDAYKKTITVIQYPSLYIKNELSPTAQTGGSYYSGYYTRGYVYINNQQSTSTSSANNWKYVDNMVETNSSWIPNENINNNNPNMYVITTTVMDSQLPYVLGDPRKDVSDNTTFSFESAPAKYGESPRRGPLYYYPTDRLADGSDQTQSRAYNMVAPSFRIASSYGRCYGDDSYEAMARRCEAYQEAGYPAGRWRVPTKGELEYITTLSAKGLIPSLFNVVGGGSYSIYMSAHGVKQINADGTVSDLDRTTGWVRCVYDEWYWKDDKVANNTFTWGDKQR